MSFEPRDYLRHILVEADYLMAQRADLKFEQFVANETLRRAFVRSFEIIGSGEENSGGISRPTPVGRVAGYGWHARPPDS